jgi:hypothetical protein
LKTIKVNKEVGGTKMSVYTDLSILYKNNTSIPIKGRRTVDLYRVKCITVMEEVFEMYAEDEEDALKQVAEEDPDCMLKEQNTFAQSNFKVERIEENCSYNKLRYKILDNDEEVSESWCYAYQLEGVRAVYKNRGQDIAIIKY